jgi:hypothetical protein
VANLSDRSKAPKVLLDKCLEQAVFSASKLKPKKQKVADAIEFLSGLNAKSRRLVHDDITVAVLFSQSSAPSSQLLQDVHQEEEGVQFDDAEVHLVVERSTQQ